jgi:hypothetical protein
MTIITNPELFEAFIEENPAFIEYLERALEAENKVIL